MSRRCSWPGGCTTVLSEYNKGDQCSIHQRMNIGIHGKSKPARETPVKRPSAPKPVVISEEQRQKADKIAEAACLEFGVPREDLTWEHENPAMNLAKNVIAYILKTDCGLTIRQIQEYLKRRGSYSLAHYHMRRTALMISGNHELAERVERIRLNILPQVP